MPSQTGKKTIGLFVLGTLFALLLAGIFYWQAIGADISNPRGNFWRVVRHGIPAYTSTPMQGHTVLIVNGGENWREIRNGLIMRGSQGILALALLAMGLFYFFVGSDKLEKPRSGVKIERFTLGERILAIRSFPGTSRLQRRCTIIAGPYCSSAFFSRSLVGFVTTSPKR
jgi:hypothetical protein